MFAIKILVNVTEQLKVHNAVFSVLSLNHHVRGATWEDISAHGIVVGQ
jgi:hypothetical protein